MCPNPIGASLRPCDALRRSGSHDEGALRRLVSLARSSPTALCSALVADDRAGSSEESADAEGRKSAAIGEPLRGFSLGTKISAGVVALIAVASVSLGIRLADSERENLVASKRAAAVAFSDLFAASIAPAVDFRDEEGLQYHLRHFRARPDALRLAVWVPDLAAPLVQTAADGEPGASAKPPANVPSLTTLADRVVVVRAVEGPVGRIGTTELVFSLAAENQTYRLNRQRILLGVAGLGVVLAGVILLLLRTLIATPLRDLTNAAKAFQAGQRPTVRVRSHDEVGTLAEAFNAMVATIADRERKVAEAYRELQEVSLTDPLTGLRNRRFFAETVRQETARSMRRFKAPAEPVPRNRDVVVLLIDLDFFKRINDTYGHAAGDEVLKETGRRLLQAMRQSDFVLRWGGEEFLVIARDTERQDASVIAGRLLQSVGGEAFSLTDGTRLAVTCSMGWAPFPWDSLKSAEVDLERQIQVADRALYHAKRSGRNRATGVELLPGQSADTRLPDDSLEELDGKLIRLAVTEGPTPAANTAGLVVPSRAPQRA